MGVIVAIVVMMLTPRALHTLKIDPVSRIAMMFSWYRLLLTPQRLLTQASITFLGAAMIWATLYFALRAAGLRTDLLLVASFVPFIQIINSVPFLYLGWGGRELAFAATLGTFSGLSLGEALAVSAAWGVASMVAGVANGIFVLGRWQSAKAGTEAADLVPRPPTQ